MVSPRQSFWGGRGFESPSLHRRVRSDQGAQLLLTTFVPRPGVTCSVEGVAGAMADAIWAHFLVEVKRFTLARLRTLVSSCACTSAVGTLGCLTGEFGRENVPNPQIVSASVGTIANDTIKGRKSMLTRIGLITVSIRAFAAVQCAPARAQNCWVGSLPCV